MIVPKNTPFLAVDWDKVTYVKVKVEQNGLRWRYGTTDAKKNMTYNAHDTTSGPPYWPGSPILYPEDGPAKNGDEFIMPLIPACEAFGYWFAPLEVPKGGKEGFTLRAERERVAMFWGWYKMPKGDGTMHPPMNRIGAPNIPKVAITPLNQNFKPILVEGEEVEIRPWDFFDFGNANMYDADLTPQNTDVASLLSGFTAEEIDEMRELLKGRRGKQKAT